jgi:hypothetical protein
MNRLSPRSQKQQLKQEIWFHGSVSRSEAESMLTGVNIFISKYIYRLEITNTRREYNTVGLKHKRWDHVQVSR